MIRAIALDDEPPALRVLSHFCGQVDFVDLQRTFTRTDEAQQYIDQTGTDLLFLDINMPFVSGTDFYRATQGRAITTSAAQAPMVIFTTAYAEYAVEGFTLNAVDYLLKPFTFERFVQAVTKARDYFDWQRRYDTSNRPIEEYLYVRADYTVYKLALADIVLIEGLDDYVKIHLESSNHPIVARMTMKAMLDKLPQADTSGRTEPTLTTDALFVRVHRSFIVPFARIEGIRNKTIRLAGRDIPIGASYEASVLGLFRS